MKRTCCLCGAAGQLKRHRAAEIPGGPAQWLCQDVDACAARVQCADELGRELLADFARRHGRPQPNG